MNTKNSKSDKPKPTTIKRCKGLKFKLKTSKESRAILNFYADNMRKLYNLALELQINYLWEHDVLLHMTNSKKAPRINLYTVIKDNPRYKELYPFIQSNFLTDAVTRVEKAFTAVVYKKPQIFKSWKGSDYSKAQGYWQSRSKEVKEYLGKDLTKEAWLKLLKMKKVVKGKKEGSCFPRFRSRFDKKSFKISTTWKKGIQTGGFTIDPLTKKLLLPAPRPVRAQLVRKFGNSSIPSDYRYSIPTIGSIGVEGKIQSAIITGDETGWYISCVSSTEVKPQPTIINPNNAIGLDFGTKEFITDSLGNFYNPDKDKLKKLQKRIIFLSKRLSRRKRGSANYLVTKTQLAKLKRHKAQVIINYQKELVHNLTENYQTIFVEDLKISNMTKSAKGTKEKPGKNIKQKSGLNREILNLAPAQFVTFLEQKCAEKNIKFSKVNPRYTSQTCSNCGHKNKESRINRDTFICTSCGHEDHADVNAAKNILKIGLESIDNVG